MWIFSPHFRKKKEASGRWTTHNVCDWLVWKTLHEEKCVVRKAFFFSKRGNIFGNIQLLKRKRGKWKNLWVITYRSRRRREGWAPDVGSDFSVCYSSGIRGQWRVHFEKEEAEEMSRVEFNIHIYKKGVQHNTFFFFFTTWILFE